MACQVLTRIAGTLGGVYVPGFNLSAPSGPRAFGLYYQDRQLFPSVTTSKVELRMRRCDRECKASKIRHWLGGGGTGGGAAPSTRSARGAKAGAVADESS